MTKHYDLGWKDPREIIGVAQVVEDDGKIVNRYRLKMNWDGGFLFTEDRLFKTKKKAKDYIAKLNKEALGVAIEKRKKDILKENKDTIELSK